MEKQFEELLSAGLTSKQISICLKVSQTTVNYRIRMKRLKEEQAEFVSKELNDSARQTLYDFVTKWLSPRRCPLELQDMLPERLSWNAADFAMVEDQKKAMSFLPWQTIAQKMHCSLLEIQGHWLHEVEKLREACESCGGNSEEATKMCCPGVPMITAGEFRRALSLILEQNPESARFIDVSKLQQRY
ncbi:unnamed protein product [Gongylonema pulchrum]|uniref:HTH luxR-type domain-containing protein n=1 Tax=Gongylonema pulchrum TaxID=637853 RepID=A0A183DBZ0_9BILA|nr:unnamed protein product [Gongylonema pulchrum]